MKKQLLAAASLLFTTFLVSASAQTIAINFANNQVAMITNQGAPLGIAVPNWTTLNAPPASVVVSNGLTNGASFTMGFVNFSDYNFSTVDIAGNAADNSVYRGIYYNNSNTAQATITLTGMSAVLSAMNCSGYTVKVIEAADNSPTPPYQAIALSSGGSLAVTQVVGNSGATKTIGVSAVSSLLTNDSLTLSFNPDNRAGYPGRSTPSAMIISFTPVPEPSTYVFTAGALAVGASLVVRRRRKD